MSNVVDFPGGPHKHVGNGAREALTDVAADLPYTDQEAAEKWADWVLAELWVRGFKAVPLDD